MKTKDVTIVGAGMAGLAAALRLLEQGFSVEVLEQDTFVGGKWGAHQAEGSDDYHEHCYHMLCNWYHNLWSIIDDLGIRGNFEAAHDLNYLRAEEYPRFTKLSDVGSPRTALSNLFSGVMSAPDTFLYSYSLIDLLGQDFVRTNFLDRYSVNGFMRSRAYSTQESARQHHRTLAKAFAAPSYATSAATYRNFIRYGVRLPTPMMWMMKADTQTGFYTPLLERLESYGDRFALHFLHRVDRLHLDQGRVAGLSVSRVERSPSVAHGGTAPVDGAPVDWPTGENVILSVPVGALARMIDPELFAAAPELRGVLKLRSEPMASLDLYFTRTIPDIPKGVVVLTDAAYDLTFVDNSQLWPALGSNTALNVVASDYDELAALPDFAFEPCEASPGGRRRRLDLDRPRAAVEYMLRELRRFIPFDPDKDLDLDRMYFQTNVGERLMVNEVGSWEYRPTTRCGVPNLFLAGDSCQNPVDAVTLEGATLTGLLAAEAIREADGRGAPIPIAYPEAYPRGLMAAAALAGAPYAYGAKAVATMGDQAWLTYAEIFGDD